MAGRPRHRRGRTPGVFTSDLPGSRIGSHPGLNCLACTVHRGYVDDGSEEHDPATEWTCFAAETWDSKLRTVIRIARGRLSEVIASKHPLLFPSRS